MDYDEKRYKEKPILPFSESPLCFVDYDISSFSTEQFQYPISENEVHVELELDKEYRIKLIEFPYLFDNGKFAMMILDRTSDPKIRLLEGDVCYINEFSSFGFNKSNSYDWIIMKMKLPDEEFISVHIKDAVKTNFTEEEKKLVMEFWTHPKLTYEKIL